MTAATWAGLFLDLDGTLADSLPVMRLAYTRFLARFGRTGSDAEFSGLNGPPLPDIVAALAAAHGLASPHDELLALYRALVHAAYGDVAPAAAARLLLETARRLELRTGVVTSNAADLARDWLTRVGLVDLVDTIVGGDEVSRGKPHPEPYLLALQRTGCAAQASCAVEDSLTGARAAAAAGLTTFLLTRNRDGIPAGMRTAAGLAEVADVLLHRSGEHTAGR